MRSARIFLALSALAALVACSSAATTTGSSDASTSQADAAPISDGATQDWAVSVPGRDGGSDEAAVDASIDVWRACLPDASPYTSCSATTDCCGDLTCQGTQCCMPLGSPCTSETVCCAPGLCVLFNGPPTCVAHPQ